MRLSGILPFDDERIPKAGRREARVFSLFKRRRVERHSAAADEKVESQVPMLQPEDTGTRLALREAERGGAPIWYAVQLEWSAQPIDLHQTAAAGVARQRATDAALAPVIKRIGDDCARFRGNHKNPGVNVRARFHERPARRRSFPARFRRRRGGGAVPCRSPVAGVLGRICQINAFRPPGRKRCDAGRDFPLCLQAGKTDCGVPATLV